MSVESYLWIRTHTFGSGIAKAVAAYVAETGGHLDCMALDHERLARRLEFSVEEIRAAVAHLVENGHARTFTEHPLYGRMYDGEAIQILSPAVREDEQQALLEEMRKQRKRRFGPRLSTSGWAYAMQPDGSSAVKIGYSKDPAARLLSVQTGQPTEVRLIWQGEGGQVLEAWLHACFEPFRMRGEWFDFTGRDAVRMITEAAADWAEETP